MLYSYRSWRYSTKCFRALLCLILCSFAVGLAFSILAGPEDDGSLDGDGLAVQYVSSSIFCFVLTENRRHATSAQAIVRTWGKRCDRFYFVTRLQNTSISLMMLEHFENITDITPTTLTRYTLDVLTFLERESTFTAYQWFLRASDESFVIIPNLRRSSLNCKQKSTTIRWRTSEMFKTCTTSINLSPADRSCYSIDRR